MNPTYATPNEWVAGEAIPFSLDDATSFNAAVDRMMASLGESVDLLGIGEALHGSEQLLFLRNRLFQRLVEAHGYSAIAVESSLPRGHVVNEYVAGRGPDSYAAIEWSGFSHGFGQFQANRQLVGWMRAYNSDPAHEVKLRFYGFDAPTEITGTESPRQLLHFALDYFALIDEGSSQNRRQRIDPLLGADAEWENPAAMLDPTKSIGLSEAATALRLETEDLITEMQVRRPELIAKSDGDRYWEALQYTIVARYLLNYHAAAARTSDERLLELVGIRDVIMADNLLYTLGREGGRGKVLAFAHNRHLQRSKVEWQLGPLLIIWWPVGSHLHEMIGARYGVIGTGVGVSQENGINQPEAGTLEALLASLPEPGHMIPTHKGQILSADTVATLPTRSGSEKNLSYAPLAPESFVDFDWLAFLQSTD